jgi:hypothetical protein
MESTARGGTRGGRARTMVFVLLRTGVFVSSLREVGPLSGAPAPCRLRWGIAEIKQPERALCYLSARFAVAAPFAASADSSIPNPS